jgi:predicted short-subunit dehydrogenase-like oxidoreductase (DUF2520 family)
MPPCYSAFVSPARKPSLNSKPRPNPKRCVSLLGAGALASGLAKSLAASGYGITEIVTRDQPASLRKAHTLARAVGARAVTLAEAALECDTLWLAVPDAAIEQAAAELARKLTGMGRERTGQGRNAPAITGPKVVLHASGALSSRVLRPLAECGVQTGSAHPMMTFVAGEPPSLQGVWFAVEGSAAAVRAARAMAKSLGARSFPIQPESKPLYHLFGAMLSPMLASELEAAERTGLRAGIDPRQVRKIMEPIVLRTVGNVLRQGAGKSFSGPLARGDVSTIAAHLRALAGTPEAELYRALASYALRTLPVKRRASIQDLLDGSRGGPGAQRKKIQSKKA